MEAAAAVHVIIQARLDTDTQHCARSVQQPERRAQRARPPTHVQPLSAAASRGQGLAVSGGGAAAFCTHQSQVAAELMPLPNINASVLQLLRATSEQPRALQLKLGAVM